MAITLRDAPIGGIRLTDTVQPYNSEAFEADNTRGGLINETIRGWNASGIGSASSALEDQALKAGIEGRRADQAYLQQQAQGLRQRAQMWAPTVSEATDINSLSSGVDWLGGAVGNLRSSVAPAVGGLSGAVTGTALAPFTGGVINPLTGAMIGAGVVGYNTMTDEAIGNAATDKVVQDRLRRGEITEQDILNTSRLSGAVQAPLEALVPAGLGGALAGGVKKEIGKRAAAYIGGQMLKGGGEEALTEGAQSLIGQTGQNYLRGDDLTNYDWKDVANSAAAGFAPGAVMGGTGGAATAAWNKTTEPNADGKNVWERAGDYIADRGTAAGKRQAEKEGESLRARLDAMEKQLTSTPRLDPTMSEADAAATVMQDDQIKRTAAQELSAAVLNDPDASPAKREIMERYVRSSEAGATNAHEALGAELGMYGRAQEKVLSVLTDLLGKVGIEPAPDNRGKANAMVPKKFGDISYEGPASDSQPSGEGAYSYTESSGVPANERTMTGADFVQQTKRIEPTTDMQQNRVEFYSKLFDRLDQQAAQTNQPSPATAKVRQAVALPPSKTAEEALRREKLIGKFAVDLRSWLPVGEDLDKLSESLKPRNAYERYARQIQIVRQDNPLRTLSVFDWRQLDMALTNFAKGNGDAKVRKQLDDLFGGPDVTGRVLEMYTPGRSNVNTQQYDPDGGRTSADRTVMQEDESFVEYGEADQEVGTQEQWVGENTTGFVPAFEQRRLKDAEDRIKAHSGRIEELRAVQNPSAEQKNEIQELTYAIVRAKDTPKARKYYDKNDESQRQSLGRAKEALRRDGGEGATIDEVGMVDREIAARDLTDPEDIKRAQLEIVNEVFPERALGYSPENDSVPSRRALFEKELAELVRAANTRFKALRGERTSFTADALEFTDRDISDIQFRLGKEKLNNQKYGVARGTIAFEVPGRVDQLVTSAPKLIAKMLSKRERESTEKHQGAVDENFQLLTQAITSVLSKLGKGARFGYVVTTATPQGVEGEVVVMDGQRDEFPADFKLRDLKQGDKKKKITYGDVVQSRSNKDRDYSAGLARRANQAVDELLNSEAVSDVSAMAVIEFHAENPNDAVNNAHIIALHRKFVGGQFEDRSEQEGRVSRVEEHDMKRELNIVGKKVAKEIKRSNLPKERYAQLYATRDEIKAALAKDSPSLLSAYRKHVLAVKEGRSGVVFRHTEPWSNDPDTSRELLRDSDYRKFLVDIRDKTNRDKVAEINRRLEETENEGLKKKLTLYRAKLIGQNREITLALNGGRDLRDTYLALNPEKTVVPDSWGVVASENEATSDDSGAPLGRGSNEYDPVGENAPMYRDDSGLASGSEAAYFMTGRAQSGAPTPGSRGEDNMAPNTTALPENARALYKTESPAEWVVGVLAPRNGVEAAAKAWRTVKNATTDKMKKSRDLMARALHKISEMEPNEFRLTFNKELTAQQAQTMINRAKSVIDQEKVPDDRPDVVGRSAAARSALGEGRQDDNGSPGQARGSDARVESRAASDTGQVAEALQRPETGRVAEGAAVEAAKLTGSKSATFDTQFSELTKDQLAKLLKQSDSDNDRVSEAAENALEKLEKDFIAKAKEARQIADDEARLRALKSLFDAAVELDMEYDTFARGYDQLSHATPIAENAYDKLRNDIARFASKDFLEKLDSEIEEAIDKVEDVGDDIGGAIEGALNLFEELRSIKAEQEAQQQQLFNKQRSAQTPKQDKSATKAELDAVVAEISAMVGPDTTVKIFKEINGGQWSGEWTKENGQTLIKIALGAHDKLGVGYHEAMHQLFSLLSQHGGESVKRLLGNVATNQLIMRQLKLKLAEEKAALDQLSDPEEAASYTFQFWRADGLKVGPQVDTLFKKIVNALDNLQLAVREKLFGSNKAAARRSEKAQAALAERVMQLYKNGAFADPSLRNDVIAALEKDAKAVMNKRAQVNAVGKAFTSFAKRWVYTAADAFESSGNPVLEALGKRLFHLEGDKTSHQSYLERRAMMADRYSNRVRDIFVGLNEDEIKQLGKYLNERRDPSTVAHPELRASMEQIVGRKQPDGTYKDGLLPEMRLYMMNSGAKRWEPGQDGAPGQWVDMGEVRELYWPRMWDTDKLMANVEEFLTELTADIEAHRAKGGYLEASENYPSREIAKNILNSLVNGQGANDIEETETDFDTLGVQPFMSSINRRELNWIDDKKYAKYFSDDPVFALTNYVAQSTKRAEFVREFGNGGEELATEVQRALVWEMGEATIGGDGLIEKAEDLLEPAIERWRKAYAKAVAAGVPKNERPEKPTILSEARGWLADNGKKSKEVNDIHKQAADAIKPAVEAIQAIEGTLGHDIDPRWRMVGSAVTTYQNFRLLVPALFSNINDIAGIVARGGEVSDAFNALVRAAREIRLRWKDDYSKDELAQLAENIGVVGAGSFMNGMGQAYSSQFMYGKLRRWNDALFKWNGLEAMNRAVRIEATGAAIRSIESNLKNPNKAHSQRHLEEVYGEGFDRENLLDAQGRLDMNNERNREAVMRWVNGAIIRPNASLRPSKASDPNYVLFYHLKQFAYAFQKVHLRRAYLEAKEGNYTPAMSLVAVYMPITIAADVVRESLLPDDDPPWMKQGMGAYLQHGVARANFGGVPQMYLEGVTDPAKIFGPLVNQVQDMASVPLFEDKELDRELLGALPGGTLARRLDND